MKSSARTGKSVNVGFLLEVMRNPRTRAAQHLIVRLFLDAFQLSSLSRHLRWSANYYTGNVSPGPCVCSSDATSPQDSAVTWSVLGAPSTGCLPTSWCGAFHEPPARKARFRRSRPAERSSWPGNLPQITKTRLPPRRKASSFAVVGSTGASGQDECAHALRHYFEVCRSSGRVVEHFVTPRHQRGGRRHKQRLQRRAGLLFLLMSSHDER